MVRIADNAEPRGQSAEPSSFFLRNARCRCDSQSNKRGFTLIELIIVISIIGILLTIAQPTYKNSVFRARETVLKENLFAMRSAIDQYYADNGSYPSALDALVSKGYIRAVPRDPFTNSNSTWILVPPPAPEETGVYDVKSGSNAISLSGTPYSDW